MRSLTLFRHAKTATVRPGQQDFDRQLTERGREDAARMGAILAQRPWDLALVSAARRTAETWEIAKKQFKSPPDAEIDHALYLCGTQALIARIRNLTDTIQHVLVIGHNPDLHEASVWFAGRTENRSAHELRHKFPTAAMSHFTINCAGWREAGPGTATFVSFETPGDPDDI